MRRSLSLTKWALAAAVLATPAMARAQADRPVVAVLNFDNNSFGKDRGDFDGLGKGIADLLINDMAVNQTMRLVEREHLQTVLVEQGLAKSGSLDQATAVRLGKILGAQYMITGGFMSDSKGTLVLTSHVINVETTAITNPVKLQAKGDDVLGLIGQLSTKLNSDLKLPAMVRTGDAGSSGGGKKDVGQANSGASTGGASSGGAASNPSGGKEGSGAKQASGAQTASKPVRYAHNTPTKNEKLDVRAALLYSKALDEQDAGNKAKAAELYRAVLSKFPSFGPAQANLEKVQKSGD
jgi:TolB-like protein